MKSPIISEYKKFNLSESASHSLSVHNYIRYKQIKINTFNFVSSLFYGAHVFSITQMKINEIKSGHILR